MDGSKKILIIEDEHFISELYARALRKDGYEVTIMLSGDDGLEAAKTDNFDVILLDLMLPGITGFEILESLRGPNAPEIKAKIIITTNLDQDDENRNRVNGLADGYLIKAEITPKELVKIIADLC
ncbi:MAG: response regulator [Patescibacteria group bacterium]